MSQGNWMSGDTAPERQGYYEARYDTGLVAVTLYSVLGWLPTRTPGNMVGWRPLPRRKRPNGICRNCAPRRRTCRWMTRTSPRSAPVAVARRRADGHDAPAGSARQPMTSWQCCRPSARPRPAARGRVRSGRAAWPCPRHRALAPTGRATRRRSNRPGPVCPCRERVHRPRGGGDAVDDGLRARLAMRRQPAHHRLVGGRVVGRGGHHHATLGTAAPRVRQHGIAQHVLDRAAYVARLQRLSAKAPSPSS